MKKVLGTILTMILIIAICIGAYMFVISIQNRQDRVEDGLNAKIGTEPLFTLQDYPKVDASLATQPLTDAFIENFTGTLPSEAELDYTNTHPRIC